MNPMATSNRHSDNLAAWSHITSGLLASWINDTDSCNKLIIIDSRPTDEYNQLHIQNSINLKNSKIIRKRLRSEKLSIIELLLRNTVFDIVENKYEINIVVYDAQSEHTNQLDADKSFAFILLQKLVQKFKSVSFLTGGFVNFKSEHPLLLQTVQTISSQSSSSSNNTISNLEANLSSTCTPMATTPMSAAAAGFNFPFSNFESLTPPIHNRLLSLNVPSRTPMRPSLNSSISSFNIITDVTERLKQDEDLFKQESSPSAVSSSSNSSSVLTTDEANADKQDKAIREPTKILDFLYLGSQEDALSEPTMKALNITNVLNVSISCPKGEFISEENFLRIPVNDGHVAKISPFFDVAYRFIEKCRKANNNVIIHCLAGISRSPTLAIAYLMKYKLLKSDEAYKFVKERRPTISPNFNFLGQLYEYEKQQHITNNNLTTDNQDGETPCLSFLKFTKKASLTNTPQIQANLESQPKKRFIFQFNDATPILSLPSPSQAFSNFNLNSPSTSHPQSSAATTFTTAASEMEAAAVVVMRRPTNLEMLNASSSLTLDKATTPSNSLKRPSSILLGSFSSSSSSTNLNSVFSSSPQTHQFMPITQQQQQQQQTQSLHLSQLKERKLGLIASLSPAAQSIVNPLTRTLSNTSASSNSSSSSCSCCSNVSSVSNCSFCSTSNNSQQQQQQDQQYHYQKKMKLSPIQDKYNFSNGFSLMANSANNNKSSCLLDPNPKTSFSDQQQQQPKTVNINTHELSFIDTFNLKCKNSDPIPMNESKSFETLKSLFEFQTNPKNNRSRKHQDDHSENDDEVKLTGQHQRLTATSEERILVNSSSLVNLSASNSKVAASLNSSIGTLPASKSSSSGSSSKNGSNRNSLHGSIEQLIEVS